MGKQQWGSFPRWGDNGEASRDNGEATMGKLPETTTNHGSLLLTMCKHTPQVLYVCMYVGLYVCILFFKVFLVLHQKEEEDKFDFGLV